MLNRIIKVAGISLATTIGLAVTANQVQAYDFNFNFNRDDLETSGTLRFNNALSIPTNSASANELLDWEINIKNVNTNSEYSLFGDGNGFGADNSDLDLTPPLTWNVSSTEASINSGVFRILGGSASEALFQVNKDFSTRNYSIEDANGRTYRSPAFGGDAGFVATAVSPTAVPFGVSTDLSIMILGGMYGASRLRKKLAANKS